MRKKAVILLASACALAPAATPALADESAGGEDLSSGESAARPAGERPHTAHPPRLRPLAGLRLRAEREGARPAFGRAGPPRVRDRAASRPRGPSATAPFSPAGGAAIAARAIAPRACRAAPPRAVRQGRRRAPVRDGYRPRADAPPPQPLAHAPGPPPGAPGLRVPPPRRPRDRPGHRGPRPHA